MRRQNVLALLACVCLVSVPGLVSAAPPQNNTVYEVFVRSFADSGDPDTVGDLKGLFDKLDYLNDGKPETDKDLGVGILWLMPIFPSTSYHGYDVTDFYNVNPEYGNLADFDKLITKAHDHGVRVILDIPFNHTSKEHPWFKKAISDADGKRSWYLIYPDDHGGGDGWHTISNPAGDRLKYLGLFGESMPDLNFDTPAVREEVKRIAKFWLDRGVDGFRLDAAKHIYGWTTSPTYADSLLNNKWWREFSNFVTGIKPDAVMVGEVLGDKQTLIDHAWGLNGLIDEPFMNETRKQIAHPSAGYVNRWKAFLKQIEDKNPNAPCESFAYLASHDRNPRLASDLEQLMPGNVDAGYRLGLCMMLSLSKYCVIYQGDELMQRGWKWNGRPANDGGDGSGMYDETLREPFPWRKGNVGGGQTAWPADRPGFLPKFDAPDDGVSVEEEDADAASALSLTRGLINFRNKHPGLADGTIGEVYTNSAEWMVFERVKGGEHYLVLLNMTGDGKDYRFHANWHPEFQNAPVLFWSDGRLTQWKDLSGQNQNIRDFVYVPPYGLVVLKR